MSHKNDRIGGSGGAVEGVCDDKAGGGADEGVGVWEVTAKAKFLRDSSSLWARIAMASAIDACLQAVHYGIEADGTLAIVGRIASLSVRAGVERRSRVAAIGAGLAVVFHSVVMLGFLAFSRDTDAGGAVSPFQAGCPDKAGRAVGPAAIEVGLFSAHQVVTARAWETIPHPGAAWSYSSPGLFPTRCQSSHRPTGGDGPGCSFLLLWR